MTSFSSVFASVVPECSRVHHSPLRMVDAHYSAVYEMKGMMLTNGMVDRATLIGLAL